mgnify:CR=1 FL=1
MRILVSNDDGIFSPGIKALGLAMRALGEVFVLAPGMEQSAVGHGITVRRPLRFKHTQSAGFGEIPAYRVDGTPADCVVLGVHLLGRPDLVVSGINLGVNLGLDLTHSGTVAAALHRLQPGHLRGGPGLPGGRPLGPRHRPGRGGTGPAPGGAPQRELPRLEAQRPPGHPPFHPPL